MGLSKKLLELPFFLLSLFLFFWSPAFGYISYRIQFANPGRRKDIYQWCRMMKQIMGVRIVKLGSNSLYKGGKCVYLCNHRSWADFFLDPYLTEGTAQPMSRALVFFAFPVFMATVIILKGIVLFKRGHIADKQKFNHWLDEQLDLSPMHNLLVYPEGHRSTRPTSLPLKRGMIHFAHSRGLPVQIIMTAGKERVLSEKKQRASFGATLVTSFSPVLESKQYPDFEQFSAEVQKLWDAMWAETYSAECSAKGLPELRHEAVPTYDYPPAMRRNMLLVAAVSVLLLLLVLYAPLALARWLLPHPLQAAAAVAGAALLGASFVACIDKGPISSSSAAKQAKTT